MLLGSLGREEVRNVVLEGELVVRGSCGELEMRD